MAGQGFWICMEGWIKLYRKSAAWQWATSPTRVALFWHLLLRANHKETKWRKVTIYPGQLLTGRKQLSIWTGLSEQQVRTALRDLIESKEITSKSYSKFSVITIANWQKYQQDDAKSTSTTPQQITSNQPAINQQVTTSKNVKNVKNEKNNTGPWVEWVLTYQKESGRSSGMNSEAMRKINKLIARGFTLEDCQLVCRSKVLQWGKDDKMRQYLVTATLFSEKFERYLDEAKQIIADKLEQEERELEKFFPRDKNE